MVDPEAGPGVDPEAARPAEADTVAGAAATVADAAATVADAADQAIQVYTTILGSVYPSIPSIFLFFKQN